MITTATHHRPALARGARRVTLVWGRGLDGTVKARWLDSRQAGEEVRRRRLQQALAT